jgi:hypothetical protein
MIDKEKLLDDLMQIFYEFTLDYNDEFTYEYCQGYRKGMLKIIDAVNSYTEE